MRFERPEVLLAVPAAILLLWLLVRFGRRREPSRARRRLGLLTRAAVLAALAGALAGPYRPFEVAERRGSALVLDRSGSISPEGLEKIARVSKTGAVVLPFGDRDSSDPRPALLRAAFADVGTAHLLTDGHLSGDPSALLADLRANDRGVGVGAIDEERGETAPAVPSPPRIEVPGALRDDEPFTVEVRSAGAETVRLIADGELAGSAAAVSGTAVFPDVRLPAGRHLFSAVSRAGDARSIASMSVEVEGPLRVLILGSGSLAAALATQDIRVETLSDRAPVAGDLRDIRVVVALPDFRLPADGGALSGFVRDGGGLLVATGGAGALSRYRDEAVADLLPASAGPREPEAAPPPPEEPDPPPEPEEPPEGARPAEVEKDAVTVTVVLVVDRSGSMRGEKIQLARAACYATARTLDSADRLGVLAFNQEVEWIRPIAPAGELGAIQQSLRNLDASGGTEIFLALREAYTKIAKESSAVRHVILVSDGQDVIQGFKQLVDRMRSERITLTTVGIGFDHEPRLLGTLALWGGGRFYPHVDPRRLPAVVTLDTRKVIHEARPPREEPSPDISAAPPEPGPAPEPDEPAPGTREQPPPALPVSVRAPTPLPFLSGLDFPPLREVGAAEVRFPAQVALETESGDPVLLFWRYGKGRVGLLLADPEAWRGWEDLPRFAAQTARMLAGAAVREGGTDPVIEIAGDRIRVRAAGGPPRASVVTGSGERPVALERAGPDTYVGVLPEAGPDGLLRVRVEGASGGEARAVALAPPPAEEAAVGVDDDRLARLAKVAGRAPGAAPAPPAPRRRPGRDPAHLPFLLAALALLLADVAVRRIGR